MKQHLTALALCHDSLKAIAATAVSGAGAVTSIVEGIKSNLGLVACVASIIAAIYAVLASRSAIKAHESEVRLNEAKLKELQNP